jgi:hypothetical protein
MPALLQPQTGGASAIRGPEPNPSHPRLGPLRNSVSDPAPPHCVLSVMLFRYPFNWTLVAWV